MTVENSCPDLRPFFKHVEWRPLPYSKGVLVGSDFSDKAKSDHVFGAFRNCGFWTVEEAKILFSIGRLIGGYWLEIGGLTGWTAAHLAKAGCHVASLDPMYRVPQFRARAAENLKQCGCFSQIGLWPLTSSELFQGSTRMWSGIMIDGNHDAPIPLQDAIQSANRVQPQGAILLHDATQAAPRQAYEHLTGMGWKLRYYETTHGIALCYRNGFIPPEIGHQ